MRPSESVPNSYFVLARISPRSAAGGKPALIEVRMNPEQVTNRCSIRDLRAQASGKEK